MSIYIKGTTKITGVFGNPIEHSLSPVFQNAAFQASGLDYVYIPFFVKPPDLKNAVEAIKALNIKGINITIPHKSNIVQFLDEMDQEAKILGVVNTILNDKGALKGFNTDGKGFIRSLKEDGNFLPEGKKVLILGAGGVSYAIAGQLIKERISQIIICNRTKEKSMLLKTHLEKIFPSFPIKIIDFEERKNKGIFNEIDLFINTTSLGMQERDEQIVPEEVLHKNLFVYDVVYNRKTELISMVQENGLKCLDGLSMLIYQGAISFEIWTGTKAPIEVMKDSIYHIPP
ncbi:MAG: shikimate dehydrogenase [Candidatus Omnitrophica bacterium]|nr:shikimate dehydrogenase [Candidatus Omnitrophota bacterium]